MDYRVWIFIFVSSFLYASFGYREYRCERCGQVRKRKDLERVGTGVAMDGSPTHTILRCKHQYHQMRLDNPCKHYLDM